MSMTVRSTLPVAIGVAWLALSALDAQQTPPLTPDIPPKFEAPTSAYDYVKRDVMIPMRDGVKLHTVIVIPKSARHARRYIGLSCRVSSGPGGVPSGGGSSSENGSASYSVSPAIGRTTCA